MISVSPCYYCTCRMKEIRCAGGSGSRWIFYPLVRLSLFLFLVAPPSSSFHDKSPKFLASVTDPFRCQTLLIFYWINDQVIWGTIGATLPLCTLFHLYILYTSRHIYIHTKRLTLSCGIREESFPLPPNNNLLDSSFAQCTKDLTTIV